ncbi:metal-dependent hydrolase family protein [Psychroflexus salis]|uniref:Xaa-Pro dipeptidase n=1 Tax=Psychroflexus salis TaxID=1526574 RepID=A0A916ZTH7_9FLAO|nr:amidohydrolase family protein [Psychroflexus salis]GGE11936.1 Xaa-Pro dipeptidase [Psychroflexus salis]
MRKSIFLLAILITQMAIAQQTLIHVKNYVDVENGKVIGNSSIIIEGHKIVSIKKGFVNQADFEGYINLKKHTLMPGWIDMHVHLESETNPKKYLEKYQDDEADIAYKSTVFAKRTLLAGFTTVRDLGGTGVNINLRDAINRGDVMGPRIFTAGKSLATTGGHADPTNGSSRRFIADPGPKEGVVNGEDDARKAVRQRYKNGADLIKITATGGVLSEAKSGDNPQFTLEEIKAICETAADYGFHVAAHAHGDEGMQRAILGGVKTIEHGTKMSDETMELMKKYDAYYVPTISAGKFVSEMGQIDGYYPEIVRPKALEIGPKIQSTFGRAYAKGVPIAFGTDAGVFYHGDNALEFKFMNEAGMPLMEVLQSATLTNAKLLQIDHEIGQIKETFIADLVAIEGDFDTKNLDAFMKPVLVVKEGLVVKNEL